jgi:hypothetical protein
MSATIEWHPASNPPDDEIDVILHIADGDVCSGFKDGPFWRYQSAERIISPVLHWTHLPKAPKP